MKRKSSPRITADLAAKIKALHSEGLFQHQIAALIGVNQGRISEVLTGKKYPDIPPDDTLPLPL